MRTGRNDIDNGTRNHLTPSDFHLSQNYPNPFSKRTTIKFCVPKACSVTLTVHTCDEMLVKQLIHEEKEAGTYEVVWNAADRPPGIYLCRMTAENYSDTKRMLLEFTRP